MDITQFGGLIFAYEVFAKITGLPTWTELTARRSLLALPVLVFLVWLVVHLIRAAMQGDYHQMLDDV